MIYEYNTNQSFQLFITQIWQNLNRKLRLCIYIALRTTQFRYATLQTRRISLFENISRRDSRFSV